MERGRQTDVSGNRGELGVGWSYGTKSFSSDTWLKLGGKDDKTIFRERAKSPPPQTF